MPGPKSRLAKYLLPEQSLTDTLSGYSDEGLRTMLQATEQEIKMAGSTPELERELAMYQREMERRAGGDLDIEQHMAEIRDRRQAEYDEWRAQQHEDEGDLADRMARTMGHNPGFELPQVPERIFTEGTLEEVEEYMAKIPETYNRWNEQGLPSAAPERAALKKLGNRLQDRQTRLHMMHGKGVDPSQSGRATPGGMATALGGAAVAGGAMAAYNDPLAGLEEQRQSNRERYGRLEERLGKFEREEDERNRMFSLGQYAPPSAHAAPSGLSLIHEDAPEYYDRMTRTLADVGVPGMDWVNKVFAWGQEPTAMDNAMLALEATDLIPGMAGVMTAGKTAIMEHFIRKGIPKADIHMALDSIDKEFGMDNVANLDYDLLQKFTEEWSHGGIDADFWKDVMKDGPHKDPFKLLEDVEAQHRGGLISDAEYKETINDIKDHVNSQTVPIDELNEPIFVDDVAPAPIAAWASPEAKIQYWNDLKKKYGLSDHLDMLSLDWGPGVYAMNGDQLQVLAKKLADNPGLTPESAAANDIKHMAQNAWADSYNQNNINVTDAMDQIPLPQWYDRGRIQQGLDQNPEAITEARMFREEGEAQGLAMDANSRMQRAAEQDYQPLDLHTTDATVDFTEFLDPRNRGLVYGNIDSTNAEDAAQFNDEIVSSGMANPPDGNYRVRMRHRDMPLMYKGEIFGRDKPPEWFMPERVKGNVIGGGPDLQIPDELMDIENDVRGLWRELLGRRYKYDPVSDEYIYRGQRGPVFRPDGSVETEASYIDPLTWTVMEERNVKYRDTLNRMGYEAFQVADEGNISVATTNPKRLRSRFAAFLPWRSADGEEPTGNLMAGVGAGAISLPALMSLAEGDEDDFEDITIPGI